MSTLCSHCGSHYIIDDYDPESHRVIGYKCGMCGRNKFEEQAIGTRLEAIESQNPLPIAHRPSPDRLKGGSMATEDDRHQRCAVEGCESLMVKEKLCGKHYKEKFGVSPKRKCEAKDCKRVVYKAHMCYHHYQIEQRKNAKEIRKAPDPNVVIASDSPSSVIASGTLQSAAPSAPGPLPSATSRKPITYIFDSDTFLNYGDIVILGTDGKLHRSPLGIARSQRATSQPFSVLSRKETITIEDDAGLERLARTSDITFTYRNGSPPEFNHANITGVNELLTYDDWMFLGAIASEIRRIKEGQ